MKLYYWPRTRAFTSLWMMEEVGEPYELVHVDIRGPGHPTAAYREINPMGKLAGFQDGACAMGETAAILLYVADKFPHKRLAPAPDDPRRGRFLQWLMFPATTIEPVMMEKRSGTKPNTIQSGWGDYDRAMNALEAALRPDAWLFGQDFTAADLYIGSSLRYGMMFNMIDKRPAFSEFAARATARPAYQRAAAIEAREADKAFPKS
jgi:glutathione S-transferase